ncbi:MAG: hypothetical protein H6962_03965 [Chromatiaceae bacterium]|nr:hypothetical protein [Chromatiaceae bacterium]
MSLLISSAVDVSSDSNCWEKKDKLPRLTEDRRCGGQDLAGFLGLGQAVNMLGHGLVGQRGLARHIHQRPDHLGDHRDQFLADILDQGLAGHAEKPLEQRDGVFLVQRTMLFEQIVDLLVEAHVLAGNIVVEQRVIEGRRGDTELAEQRQRLAQVLGGLVGRFHVEHQRRGTSLPRVSPRSNHSSNDTTVAIDTVRPDPPVRDSDRNRGLLGVPIDSGNREKKNPIPAGDKFLNLRQNQEVLDTQTQTCARSMTEY